MRLWAPWGAEGYSILRPEGMEEAMWKRISDFQNRQLRDLSTVEMMVKGNVSDLRIVLEPRPAR